MKITTPVSASLSIVEPRHRGADWPVVRAQQLNHYLGSGAARKQVLYDNNVTIQAGEIVAMTGPSGSGKTTLLTLIGALRTVQNGTLEVLGRTYGDLSAQDLVEFRRKIGVIFQAHNLFSSLTAYQNVRMGLQLHGLPAQVQHDRAIESLKALGLGDRLHYRPAALSGGQRQRVAIARAIASQPRLVLADEPTAALDSRSSEDVIMLFKALVREQGTSILLVTHDGRLLDMADRVVNMEDGRIVANVQVSHTMFKEQIQRALFLRN